MTSVRALELFLVFVLTLFLLALRSAKAEVNSFEFNGVKIIEINIQGASIPEEAYSDKAAVAVVNGMFTNGCYSWGSAMVEGPTNNHIIFVRSFATYREGVMCTQMMVPFVKQIELGKFPPGLYTVLFINGNGTKISQSLNVL